MALFVQPVNPFILKAGTGKCYTEIHLSCSDVLTQPHNGLFHLLTLHFIHKAKHLITFFLNKIQGIFINLIRVLTKLSAVVKVFQESATTMLSNWMKNCSNGCMIRIIFILFFPSCDSISYPGSWKQHISLSLLCLGKTKSLLGEKTCLTVKQMERLFHPKQQKSLFENQEVPSEQF